MDRHAADIAAALALPVVLAALLVVVALWQPRFLTRAIAHHPRRVDRGYRVAILVLFAVTLIVGTGWPSLLILVLAIVGTALGRRRPSR